MKIDLTGMTLADCPKACTAERCVMSTVSVCKHPVKCADDGCGPITLRNRHEARRFLGLNKETAL
jgi:hypothetical protein